jgi:nitrilase
MPRLISTIKETVMKVAVVQEPPVYLNLDASMERAINLVSQAATDGAKLMVFPEAWFPGYPTFCWRLSPGADMGKTDELFAMSQANSIDLSRNGMALLQEAAAEHEMVIVVGYQEIDGEVSGSTIFNSCAIIDADGRILNNHRKLMPTNPERMIWGFGDGSGLNVVETAVGRIGALLCWENYMPLARYALYAQNIDIYVAPTWDTGDTWLATMQHIAREGGCWVIGCATALEVSDIPEEVPHREILFPNKDEWVNPGDAVVYKPFGGIAAGPMHREKGFLWADIDVSDARASRRKFDASGHYARPDVFSLSVDRSRKVPVSFS